MFFAKVGPINIPVSDSTKTATAYPLTPPSGASIPASASFASVVGAPSFVNAQPGSNSAPACAFA